MNKKKWLKDHKKELIFGSAAIALTGVAYYFGWWNAMYHCDNLVDTMVKSGFLELTIPNNGSVDYKTWKRAIDNLK